MRTRLCSSLLLLAVLCAPAMGQFVEQSLPSALPGRRPCRPWLLQTTVSTAGLRVSQVVEHVCTAENAPLWRLRYVFTDASGEYDYAYAAEDPREAVGIRSIALEGLSQAQADVVLGPLSTLAKDLKAAPSPEKDAAARALLRGMLSR